MNTSVQPSDLCQLFYISRSLATPLAVEQILASSRHQNLRRGVTGALLFSGGHFAQLLEGPALALRETMASIDADPRHEAVTRLIEEPIARRRFNGWSMGFFDALGADDLIEQLLANPPIKAERAQRVMERMLAPCQHEDFSSSIR